MSVILTAGRKSVQAKKSKKHKKKHVVAQDVSDEPPISTPGTVVWYWVLDGSLTTVMFTKDTNEVWCNGADLATTHQFPDYGNKVASIQFIITIGNVHHQATIVKSALDGAGTISHELFVDGYMIHDNIGQSPEESVTEITMEEFYGQPPSYDSIVNDRK